MPWTLHVTYQVPDEMIAWLQATLRWSRSKARKFIAAHIAELAHQGLENTLACDRQDLHDGTCSVAALEDCEDPRDWENVYRGPRVF